MATTKTSVDVRPYLTALSNVEKAKKHLKKNIVNLLRSHIKGWENAEESYTKIIHIGGAMTNLIFMVIFEKLKGIQLKALVRIYGEGTEIFFSRQEEIKLFKLLSKQGIGVELLYAFENGRIEKVIEGRTLIAEEIRQKEISWYIAKKMQDLHQVEVDEIPHTPMIINKLYEFLTKAKLYCDDERFMNIDFDEIHQSIQRVESLTNAVHSPIVFCHGDLQYGNIMYVGENVVFIDFEYSGYNPRGFDIANHFCEWAYDYTKEEMSFAGDFTKYPTKEEQVEFFQAYLSKDPQQMVTEEEILQLGKEVEVYVLVSHLFWALWGLIQSTQSGIDFEYFSYSKMRLQYVKETLSKLG